MDEREMREREMREREMHGDGRNPYGSRGGYVVSSRGGRGRGRGRRGDRGMMDYGYDGRVMQSYPTMHPQGDYGDMRGDMRMRDYDMARNQPRGRNGRFRRDYGEDYEGDMRRGEYEMDGHHMGGGRQGAYEPVEFMGYCSGYYGSPDHGDYRGRDYGYGRRDYGYEDYGDFGEVLSDAELARWEKKLMEQLDDREKQMFKKEAIIPKFKQMGIEMKGFTEEELYVFTLAKYLDHKHSIGQNPDLAIKLAKDGLCDQDIEYQGSEYLTKYFDTFVEPRD